MKYLPPLNDHNLPYPDTIHPIVVHFVIAMILFAILCDLIGYFSHNYRLYEVSWWNLFFATISIFIAIVFGQIEAGLAEAYTAVESTLNLHTIFGWSLSGVICAVTAWRYVLRSRDPKSLPLPFLGVGVVLVGLVCFQTYLGDLLVWVYGLHTVTVVEAFREGTLQ
ncbi:putative membrane protein [Chamaesiphon minutus PCC 6605]|uniref:Putative membrane protein n=1 Tax=Chamaesiphon minutus (strain ATCC 27169 / PCC 6605) TaxID=1173020 RepID=K9U9X4_CHAP6|nr:putative membrane protein [Chamaesiphon minutus PCC 6605]